MHTFPKLAPPNRDSYPAGEYRKYVDDWLYFKKVVTLLKDAWKAEVTKTPGPKPKVAKAKVAPSPADINKRESDRRSRKRAKNRRRYERKTLEYLRKKSEEANIIASISAKNVTIADNLNKVAGKVRDETGFTVVTYKKKVTPKASVLVMSNPSAARTKVPERQIGVTSSKKPGLTSSGPRYPSTVEPPPRRPPHESGVFTCSQPPGMPYRPTEQAEFAKRYHRELDAWKAKYPGLNPDDYRPKES